VKNKIGAKNYLYPMPAVIVGAKVEGRANFMTVAYCGIAQNQPPMIFITLGEKHYTNKGIKKNKCFSINIPSKAMVEITDYVGLVSGKNEDKSELFDIFYGELKNAPMISSCPVNLECALLKKVSLKGTNEIFIGEIVEAYCDDKYLTDGLPDIKKIEPLVFSMYDWNYYEVGAHLGKALHVGKDFKKKS
jgi:flavin reductase (DIM6/NTAB) family NADH-FMN oxidoreductase RutF